MRLAALLALLLIACDSNEPDPEPQPLSDDEIVALYSAAVCSWVERCRPGAAATCAANMEVQMANRYATVPGFPRPMTDVGMDACQAFVDELSCDGAVRISDSAECDLNP